MKHPRRTFLHLAAGATALTYLYPGLICAAIAFFVTQSPARADIITEWNQTAVTTLVQARLPTGAPTRALAMLHAAMFEAVNSIDPQFQPYKASIDARAYGTPPTGIGGWWSSRRSCLFIGTRNPRTGTLSLCRHW
jgi:hypothetical protein